jgi:hypothetical protein
LCPLLFSSQAKDDAQAKQMFTANLRWRVNRKEI